MFGACHQLFLTFATIITAVVGMSLRVEEDYIKQRQNWAWRLAYAGPLFFSLLQMTMLVLLYTFESPLFYVSNQDMEMVNTRINYRQGGY